MQNKAASVVAHFGNIPLHTVTTKASFRYHQPKMGGFPAHPKGIYIGNIPSAENMGVASLPDTSVTVLIFILQRKPKPDIRQRSKKGLLRHILYGKYRCQYLSLPDTFADSLQLRRAKHLSVNKILPKPVHSIGLPRKHDFFHHTCFPAFPALLVLPLIVLPFTAYSSFSISARSGSRKPGCIAIPASPLQPVKGVGVMPHCLPDFFLLQPLQFCKSGYHIGQI